MTIQMDIDKVVFDFVGIKFSSFLYLYQCLRQDTTFRDVYNKGYIYNFAINYSDDCMFFSYLNYRERESGNGHAALYTLRLETNPMNFAKYQDIIDLVSEISSDAKFVSADVAYDVPLPMERIFVMSQDNRRKIRLDNDTRYFGKGEQRKHNGYCRIYNKAAELREQKQVPFDGDLTRIEIVYKPLERIHYSDVFKHPPRHNDYYYGKIIDDLSWCTPKMRQRILNKQVGIGRESQYIRREIKKALANQVDIDFNRLASEHWENKMSVPVKTLIAKRVGI